MTLSNKKGQSSNVPQQRRGIVRALAKSFAAKWKETNTKGCLCGAVYVRSRQGKAESCLEEA